ncbi:unnamed protein product [Prorocentrum cordatum]|uniref:Uncharacterized protein n=1 Tax=Prorocentrum cordatum TaxID=2364126 RepID=A0ABN9SN64_9DINO|nr:unnamed protein product [Polarella glacialis]
MGRAKCDLNPFIELGPRRLINTCMMNNTQFLQGRKNIREHVCNIVRLALRSNGSWFDCSLGILDGPISVCHWKALATFEQLRNFIFLRPSAFAQTIYVTLDSAARLGLEATGNAKRHHQMQTGFPK